MSTLLKKPFIEGVIDTLSTAELSSLAKMLDGADSTIFRSLINEAYPITEADLGVSHCVLETDGKVFTGYLVYNKAHCVLVSYEGGRSQAMQSLVIDLADDSFVAVDEELSIAEFRRIVSDRSIAKTENGSTVYGDGIEIKRNGDVVIGKNLEVEGTTKLNNGFKPIHQYSYQGFSINVYFEKETGSGFSFLGDIDEIYIVLGYYELDSGNIKNVELLTTKNTGAFIYENTWIEVVKKTALVYKQDKLYRHNLTLTASDKTYILVYDSTSNLIADSVADLRTLMKVSSTNDNVILPLCATDLTGTAVLQVTTALCKIGTANVTAVTDNVTL